MKADLADIETEITRILAGFLDQPPALSGDTDLVADLDLESVQVMEFLVEVEDHYGHRSGKPVHPRSRSWPR